MRRSISIFLFLVTVTTSLAAQSAPGTTTATPTLIPTLGGIPQAPTSASEVKPAQPKAARMYAILGQWHGSAYSESEFRVFTRIYEASHWRKYWRESLGQKEPIDFDEGRHRAVHITLGTRPTGGYAVKVVRAYEEDNQLVLEYIEREPARDEYVTQALTTPWVIVLLPRTEQPVITRKASAAWSE